MTALLFTMLGFAVGFAAAALFAAGGMADERAETSRAIHQLEAENANLREQLVRRS